MKNFAFKFVERAYYKYFLLFFIIGVVLYLTACVFSQGHHHCDEHYQILEFTALKLGSNQPGDLAWEYASRLRPAIQPAIAFAVIRFLESIGSEDPFFQAFVLRLLSAVLSMICMLLLIKAFIKDIHIVQYKKLLILLTFILWFFPYLNVRFSSETWSGALFFSGLALVSGNGKTKWKKFLLAGVLLGGSFICRYQSGFFIAGLVLWIIFIKKDNFHRIILLVSGILTSIIFGIVIDRWFYGEWTLTSWNYSWNYLDFNIIQGKVSEFGISPWYFYFSRVFERGIAPISAVIILSVFFFWFRYPKHIITWSTLPFILIHILISHKEFRFIFPVAYITPVIFVLALQGIQIKKNIPVQKSAVGSRQLAVGSTLGNKRLYKLLLSLFLIINIFPLSTACLKPANQNTPVQKLIYDYYRNDSVALLHIGENPYNPCGLPLKFYKRSELTAYPVKSPDDLLLYAKNNKNKKILLVADKLILEDKYILPNIKYKLIYNSLPLWVTNFNFNNWLEKTSVRIVYECTLIT